MKDVLASGYGEHVREWDQGGEEHLIRYLLCRCKYYTILSYRRTGVEVIVYIVCTDD